MSQAGYTPIQLYYSTTAAATPSAGNLAAGELAVNITDGKLFYKDNGGVVRVLATAAGSAGDVVGPGSSTDNALVRFDGTTGKLVQNSVGVLSDAGVLTGLTGLTSSGSITFSGLTSGRVTYAGTGGLLQDSANLTFDGTTLTANALTVSNAVTLSGGTANGVAYLNGSKVLTTGSALTFDGTNTLQVSAIGGAKVTSRGTSGQTILEAVTTSNIATLESRPDISYSRVTSSAYLLDFATLSNQPILFTVNNTEQMRLTSTGLGIGTSSPVSGTKLTLQESASNPTALALLNRNSTQTWKIAVDAAAVDDKILAFIDNATSTVRLALTDSGNLGLGTTSFASNARLQVAGGRSYFGSNDSVYAVHVAYNNTRAQVGQGYYIGATDSAAPSLVFSNNDGTARTLIDSSGNVNFLAGNIYTQSTSGIFFTGTVGNFNNGIYGVGTNNVAISTGGTERARIDSSGNLLVGTTSAGLTNSDSVALQKNGPGGVVVVNHANGTVSGSAYTFFAYNGGSIGGITQNGTTAVAYNTSSDYRLKENVQPMTGALAKVAALKPVTYKWKSDGSDGEGFIAHELAEVCPAAVTGEKDAVDAEGNPQYQGIDTSFLVATLTAAIQEQQAIIQTLTARVAALESN
jgi:hypothetical protein